MADSAEDVAKRQIQMLERQKEQLKKAKARKGQKPTAAMKRSRRQIEQEQNSMAMHVSMESMMGQSYITSTFIGEAYTPCTKPLSSLKSILLGDLLLETQHRGRVLVVRTLCNPARMSAVQNGIEDESGDVERVSVYNIASTTVPEKILPKGAVLAIKEPYFKCTADGGVTVRVDHPSDLVRLNPVDELVPLTFRINAWELLELHAPATELKKSGNKAFEQGDWLAAIDYYSQGLNATAGHDNGNSDDVMRTLYRNRAVARLRLGRYEQALEDALKAIIPRDTDLSDSDKSMNIKALFRAGRAAYELGDFREAKKHYHQALQLDPNHKEAMSEVGRTHMRLAEYEHGIFNFATMNKVADESTQPRIDCASFTKNIKDAPTGSFGRGLFATRALKRGDVVFVEKAFYVAFQKPDRTAQTQALIMNVNTNRMAFGTHAERLYGIVDKMLWNPGLAAKFLRLFDGGDFETKEAKIVDGVVAVDTFQVQAIAELNGFGCSTGSKTVKQDTDDDTCNGSTGIWLQASFMNHSCMGNATNTFIGDVIVVRATKDIEAGDQIFMPYYPPTKDYAKRLERLENWYGFTCGCALCQAELISPLPAVERLRICDKFETFGDKLLRCKDSTSRITASQIDKVEKLREQIEATYDEKLFKDLPRLGCIDLDVWLCKAYASASSPPPKKSIENGLMTLRHLGFKITTKADGKLDIDCSNAVTLPQAVHGAMYASHAHKAMGNVGAASTLEEFARETYRALFADTSAFEAQFGV